LEDCAVKAGLDHVVIGVAELDEGIRWFESRTGVRPVYGGRHNGVGTHNALAGLGGDAYVELFALDPDRQVSNEMTALLAAIEHPTPCGWLYRCDDIAEAARRLKAAGIEAAVSPMTRTTPGGARLRWRVLAPVHRLGLAVPALIDWGSTPSPASDAPKGCTIVDVTAFHPDVTAVKRLLDAMGIGAAVRPAARSGVRFRLATPRGDIEVEGWETPAG
jgi:catechol 2,3-dioxygenase-like lactoylglutathione lyase family enzyme